MARSQPNKSSGFLHSSYDHCDISAGSVTLEASATAGKFSIPKVRSWEQE